MTAHFDFPGELDSIGTFDSSSHMDFDNSPSFESVNSASGNIQTVSPKDVLMDAATQSAPSSGAFTNFYTPKTYTFDHSPQYDFSADTSPLYHDEDLGAEAENWGSLFPEEDVQQSVENSPAIASIASPMARTTSSPGQQSLSVGGKSSRRTKPLKHLNHAAETDPVAKKRMKNTEAARKSRAKKETERSGMASEIARLNMELEKTKTELAHYKALLDQRFQ